MTDASRAADPAGPARWQGRADHRRRQRARTSRRRAVRGGGRQGRRSPTSPTARDAVDAIRAAGGSGLVRRRSTSATTTASGARWSTRCRRSAGCTCSTTTPASRPATTTARPTPATPRGRRCSTSTSPASPGAAATASRRCSTTGGGQHHQRRVVRGPRRCRHAADRVHRVEGGRAVDDTRDRRASTPARASAPTPSVPGPVLTPLLAKFLSDDAKRQRRLVHVPMGRFGEPIEIAKGALFLASDDSSFMTGQSLLDRRWHHRRLHDAGVKGHHGEEHPRLARPTRGRHRDGRDRHRARRVRRPRRAD